MTGWHLCRQVEDCHCDDFYQRSPPTLFGFHVKTALLGRLSVEVCLLFALATRFFLAVLAVYGREADRMHVCYGCSLPLSISLSLSLFLPVCL